MNTKKDSKKYIARINTVQDYIDNHLHENLTIDKLAGIAQFSPFYFHKLFKHITNESLYSYIKRLRLEKAVFLLKTDSEKSIMEIAMEVGFSNQASFAKAFKKIYHMSASEYKKSKNGQKEDKNGKNNFTSSCYNNEVLENDLTNACKVKPLNIDVKYIDSKALIYIRHTGHYKGDTNLFNNLFTALYKWANARNLIQNDSNWLVIYHDYDNLTKDERVRLSIGLEVNQKVNVAEPVGEYSLASGKYVIGTFKLSEDQYQAVWDYMLFNWLPKSGYKHDDRVAYEEYSQNLNNKSCAYKVVNIYIPISPL